MNPALLDFGRAQLKFLNDQAWDSEVISARKRIMSTGTIDQKGDILLQVISDINSPQVADELKNELTVIRNDALGFGELEEKLKGLQRDQILKIIYFLCDGKGLEDDLDCWKIHNLKNRVINSYPRPNGLSRSIIIEFRSFALDNLRRQLSECDNYSLDQATLEITDRDAKTTRMRSWCFNKVFGNGFGVQVQ